MADNAPLGSFQCPGNSQHPEKSHDWSAGVALKSGVIFPKAPSVNARRRRAIHFPEFGAAVRLGDSGVGWVGADVDSNSKIQGSTVNISDWRIMMTSRFSGTKRFLRLFH